MRTKTLLLTAALSVAAAATSMADVFSVNAVGYINVPMAPGFNLVANQLNAASGANTLKDVFPSVPEESQVVTFANNVYSVDIFIGGDWYDNATGNPSATTVEPGKGFFFFNPLAVSTNITLVGEVPQGDTSLVLPPGFKLVSSIVPQQLSLSAANGFPQIDEMQFLTFSNNAYNVLINLGGQWFDNATGNPVDANPAVAQGFFIFNPLTTSTQWDRTFNVNN